MTKQSLLRTMKLIELVKQLFSAELKSYGMIKLAGPVMVGGDSCLNDDLAVKDSAVRFKTGSGEYEIVQSLAKWKRDALRYYDAEKIYVDMIAVRRSEELSKMHSYTVDQWDWEMRINEKDRTLEYLKGVVSDLYRMLSKVEDEVNKECGFEKKLPASIYFITSQELEDKFPSLTPKQREEKITKEKGAVFIMGIGHKLKSGIAQDVRADDYDDWNLNGDILVYSKVLDCSMELSSMGIRVSPESFLEQRKILGRESAELSPFHKKLVENKLPFSIGGGIGQSRVVMFMLEKKHIGEVQVSGMSEEYKRMCEGNGIQFLYDFDG